MLHDEHGIIKEGDVSKRKLDRIARDAAPVTLKIAIDALLRNAEHSAQEIEEDLPYAPALCALVPPVGESLRRVLDERDEHLDIADGVDDVERAPICARVDADAGSRSEEDDEVGCKYAGEAAG